MGNALEQVLAEQDARYNELTRMVSSTLHGPGYHTTLPDGAKVHSTREALDYAIALLAAGRTGRAVGAIEAVLGLQDTNPDHHTYGIWPWFLEESLEEMSPPDWNWADFCGARLLVILKLYAEQLEEALKARIREAVGHAAEAIVRRDMGPHYTNIAIMGGTVTAGAGEALEDSRLIVYGRERLQRMVAYTREQGSFNEYNSPTYTMVALEECERALHLVSDGETRQAAEWLLEHAWQVIAEHWHPATGQWAGPHSRAYADRLSAATVQRLSERVGVALPAYADDSHQRAVFEALPPLPCPDAWRARFEELPEPSYELARQFVKKPDQTVTGATWFGGEACLGSVNEGTFWNQCRPLIGYWRTKKEPAVVFRPRFLHDGRDFATAVIANRQSGPRVESKVFMREGLGDFHCHLDAPKDGRFPAEDFRLRLELSGQGVSGEQLSETAYILRAGSWELHVEVQQREFLGATCSVECGVDVKLAFVDVVAYSAPRRSFGFPELGSLAFSFAVELREP